MRLLLSMLLLFQAAGANSDKAIQSTLNAKYVRKLFTMRDFPIGARLLFDADGKLVSGGSPGTFTLDGNIHVDSAKVLPDKIEIKGHQTFLNYNSRTKKLEEYLTNEDVRLEFARKAGTPVEVGLDAVLLPMDRLGASVPSYWTRFLEGKVDPQTVLDPVTGVMVPRASESQNLVPRVTKQVTPEYPALLKPYGVTGYVVLHVIVDEQGKPSVSDVVEPAGFGFEHAAIEAVKQWQYEPARQDGKPVKVYFRVRVNFRPPTK